MSRKKKFLGGLFLLLCVVTAGVCWQFQNEIKAVQYHFEYTPEEQAVLVQENEKRMQNLLEQVNIPAEVVVNSEPEKLQEIEKSAAEVSYAEDKSDKNESNAAQQTTVKQQNPSKEEQHSMKFEKQNYDPELAGMIGEIYALRTSFICQLDQLLVEAKHEYAAVPEEKREKQKSVILNKYISKAGGLEANCDGQMDEILSRMKQHLKKNGGDTALINEIQEVYDNEKALKKAYYLSFVD